MGEAGNGLEPQNRPITAKERELIEWLLRHGKPGAEQFLSQIAGLTVAWKCACGCPTVNFALEGERAAHDSEHILADFLATTGEEPVGVILFQKGRRLSSLEVYSLAGTDEPFGLPEIETIHAYERSG
jgi:hypothetical protein